MSEAADWFVYVLWSEARSRTYVGIALDPSKRLDQHNGLRAGGARSTRSGRPWILASVFGPFPGRGPACEAEASVKKLKGRARLDWEPTIRLGGS